MELEPNEIREVLDVAGQGTKTLGGALDLLGKAKTLFSGNDSAATSNELQKLVGELSEELMKARIANLEVVTKLQELRATAVQEDMFVQKLALYETHQLPRGGQILALIRGKDAYENWSKICPRCAAKDRVIIPLQGDVNSFNLECPNCEARYANAEGPSHRADIGSRGSIA